MTRDEMDAIVRLLEAEYASPAEAAEKIFLGVIDIVMHRDAWGIGLTGIAWGPFYDQRTVKKVAAIIGGGIAKLYAPAPLVTKALAEFEDPRYCDLCKHPRLAHADNSWKWKGEVWARQAGCCVTKCECLQVYSTTGKRVA